jgi:hypothetical protein
MCCGFDLATGSNLLHVVVSILSLGHGVNMREKMRFGGTKLNAPGVVSISYRVQNNLFCTLVYPRAGSALGSVEPAWCGSQHQQPTSHCNFIFISTVLFSQYGRGVWS